ncbi:M56 family metallopeptidase [uncultured Sphingomonas sp.]|uniref:M56 family metallopeptidase n=1 Tax=uncultured Sphingomonas sp. TaxID=158754 RepID=UPI0035CAF648
MIGWLVEAALGSTLLIGVVLLLREPTRRLFGPTVAYALWALPALRLVLPPMPEWRRDIATTPISRVGELVIHFLDTAVTAEEVAAANVVLLLWLIGGAAFLGWHLVRYALFRARILRGHDDLARIGRVRVVRSAVAPGPLAFGVLRPHVAMPTDLDRVYDADERALAIAHELGHHARGDLLANWVALLVLAVHWWNPLAWIAHRAFRTDQELANDAHVLAECGSDAVHAYARAIVKAASGYGHAAACHLRSVSDLKGRIRMLKADPPSPRRLRTGIAGVALFAVPTLALTASGSGAAATMREGVGATIGLDLTTAKLDWSPIDVPSAPVPPIVPAQVEAPVAFVPRSLAAIPPVPPTPPLPSVPPAPPVPPVPAVDGTRQVTVIRTRDGQAVYRIVRTRNGREFDLSSISEVLEQSCGRGDRPLVRREMRDGKPVTIICIDRIGRVADQASRAATEAGEIGRGGLAAALFGLRGARTAIDADPHLSGEQKRRAREGVEQGIREIENNLAKPG